jgi:hypothetical protein
MSILTAGVWAVPVWLPISIYNSIKKDKHVTAGVLSCSWALRSERTKGRCILLEYFG